MKQPTKFRLIKRVYKDNITLSIIGFGGILVMGMEQSEADRLVEESIRDIGINYFDVAPSYGDGEAELKLGKALRNSRKEIFLACKTMERNAAGAEKELHRSLQRFHTDYFDLYQFHAVTDPEDVEQIFAPGGAMQTFLKARDAGKIRYIGFSAHSETAALAMLEKFTFDSILFPINFVCMAQGNFGPGVIQKATDKGVAILALKTLAYSPWPEGMEKRYPKCWYRPVDDPRLARQALRFTLSEPVTAAIPPGDERLFRLALELASDFKPMTDMEKKKLLKATEQVEPLFRA
ncbi:MAG: aldo/keto reductase [bacterium]|nr:MAG: aldo/keto reductase [bacterium]